MLLRDPLFLVAAIASLVVLAILGARHPMLFSGTPLQIMVLAILGSRYPIQMA